MAKNLNLKWIVPLAAAGVVLLSFATFTFANPFYTGTKAQSATATSTQSFLNVPTAATSTTPIYDSYEQYGTNQPNSGNLTLPDSVAILLNGVASSTATTLTLSCEFSDNYNGLTGNGDWYQNEIYPATSTGPFSIGTPISFVFTYSTTTVGGVFLGSTQRFQKLVTCPVPLRYVRVVAVATGSSTSLWMQIVPKKQRN